MASAYSRLSADQRSRRVRSVLDMRRRKREMLQGVKAAHGCKDCGERDVVVLELDHRDPAEKSPRLKTAQRNNTNGWFGLGWAALRAEIAKCDVVCANCHRRRTARQQSWKLGNGERALQIA